MGGVGVGVGTFEGIRIIQRVFRQNGPHTLTFEAAIRRPAPKRSDKLHT